MLLVWKMASSTGGAENAIVEAKGMASKNPTSASNNRKPE
jgi:hypothetical protein